MARRTIQKLAHKALTADEQARRLAKTADSFQNFAAAIGYGTGNLTDFSSYGFNPITRIRTLLEWIHRGSWLGGVAIDLVADDMTRAGVEIKGDLDPDKMQAIEQAATELKIWNSINDAVKWS